MRELVERATRLVEKPGIERRLSESVEVALNLADDIVVINTLEGGDRLFSRRLACTGVWNFAVYGNCGFVTSPVRACFTSPAPASVTTS